MPRVIGFTEVLMCGVGKLCECLSSSVFCMLILATLEFLIAFCILNNICQKTRIAFVVDFIMVII